MPAYQDTRRTQHPRLKEVATPGDKRNPITVNEYESDEEVGPPSRVAVSVNSSDKSCRWIGRRH